jgi:tetratricopeptide (TPR) repeat protein
MTLRPTCLNFDEEDIPMTTTRLQLLMKRDEASYAPDSPLLLAAYALYRDTETNESVAQLKWQNLDKRSVRAVMVALLAYDAFNQRLGESQYQYDNLNIASGSEFGSKNPIIIRDGKIARCDVALKAVSFADGTVWRSEEASIFEPLPKPAAQPLTGELYDQLKRDLKNRTRTAKYAIQTARNLWQCGCGSWQKIGMPCAKCRITQDELTGASDPKVLQAHFDEYTAEVERLRIEREKQAEAARIEQEKREDERKKREAAEAIREAARAKRKKKVWVITCIAAVLVLAVALLTKFCFIPMNQYNNAVSLMESGNYDDAHDAFAALGDYKDCAERLQQVEANSAFDAGDYGTVNSIYASLPEEYQDHASDLAAMYSDAIALMSAGKYDEAATTYIAIGDTENANLSTYRYAGQFAAQGEYKQAADIYFFIADYEDSREQHYQMGLQARENGKLADACSILSEDIDYSDAKESVYQIGVTASDEQLYEVSVPCFTAVGAYKDATMKLTMDTYAWGGQLYDNGDYDQSAEVFASMGDFSDALIRANEARYAAAVEQQNAGNYEDAKTRFNAIKDHGDSADRILQCDYSRATNYLNDGDYARARTIFKLLGSYSDSADMAKECDYRPAVNLFNAGDYKNAKTAFLALGSYSDSADMAKECDYRPAKALYDAKSYEKALAAFKESNLSGYKDSATLMNDCNYQLGKAAMENGNYQVAAARFNDAGSYSDSKAQAEECRRLNALKLAAEYEAKSAYESAYEQYELANETDKMSEIAYQVALAKVTAGDYASAIAWFEKAGYGYRNVNEQLLSIGEYYYTTQQYDEAEAVYVKVVGTGVAAQRLYELGQYYELASDLQHATKAYSEAGDYLDAIAKAKEVQMEIDYQNAESLYAEGKYVEAKEAYDKINGYKDVDSKLKACDAALEAKFAVGNYVEFGNYPQTASGTDNTPIEWLVLARDGNTALLISRYGLDAQPYNTSNTSVTWRSCTLRTWLNSTFMNKAFTAEEQSTILTTTVDNGNSYSNTQDKIFLLSYAEANKYFGVTHNDRNNTSARVKPTAYAEKKGAYTDSNYKTADGDSAGWWWLRSLGYNQGFAADVSTDGSLLSLRVSRGNGCVRPALWVDINSGIF